MEKLNTIHNKLEACDRAYRDARGEALASAEALIKEEMEKLREAVNLGVLKVIFYDDCDGTGCLVEYLQAGREDQVRNWETCDDPELSDTEVAPLRELQRTLHELNVFLQWNGVEIEVKDD